MVAKTSIGMMEKLLSDGRKTCIGMMDKIVVWARVAKTCVGIKT